MPALPAICRAPGSTTLTDVACSLAGLAVHPIKSCAGIGLTEALLVETGLEFDRAWMVVDGQGRMLTQREWPRMALVQPQFKHGELMLRAPGMLALHLRLDAVEAATRVRVWDDVVKAYDMGSLAAQWFSDFLGTPVRLARFDPEEKRLSDAAWTGEVQAENAFSDGFPLLVANQASLDDLNTRLASKGVAAMTMPRFRPNLVLAGLQPFDEDHIDTLEITTDEGPVVLRLVKPCVRCGIPNIDLVTAEVGPEPGATLAGFRSDARMQGGITFGMNAVILQGHEHLLRPGQAVAAQWHFD